MSERLYRIRETFAGAQQGAGLEHPRPVRPDMASCLAEINSLPGVLEPLTEADTTVLGLWLCNDAPFKDGRRMIATKGVRQITGLLRGAPYMMNHDVFSPQAIPMGRAFRGVQAKAKDGVTWCGPLFHVQHEHPIVNGKGLARSIEGGTISQASVGMYAGSFSCTICNEQAGDCEHVPGMDYGKDGGKCLFAYSDINEVEEFSAVMSGAVEGTGYFAVAAANEPRAGALDPDAIEAQVLERAAQTPGVSGQFAARLRRQVAAERVRERVAYARLARGFRQSA